MRTLLAVLILTITVTSGPSTSEQPAPEHVAVKTTQVAEAAPDPALPDEVGSLAVWARARFAIAGLDLPRVTIGYDADREACGGNTAIAIHGLAVPMVRLCTAADASEVVIKRALLHELAHVWSHDAVDDVTRTAFLELRGLTEWSDAEHWEHRGSEHAAEIVAWALMDVELLILTLPDHEPTSLAAGYRALTGLEVPSR